jgi:hypothetical protein
MPDDDTEAKRVKDQADAQSSMLRWILGGVGVGIVGIGFFAQVAFNTFMTRDEAQQNFLRQDMKAAIEKMTDVLAKSDDRTDTLVKAVDNNTRACGGQWNRLPSCRQSDHERCHTARRSCRGDYLSRYGIADAGMHQGYRRNH